MLGGFRRFRCFRKKHRFWEMMAALHPFPGDQLETCPRCHRLIIKEMI